MTLAFHGVIPELVTPIGGDGAILWDGLRREAELLSGYGIGALCVGGPMGELAGANVEEIEQACRIAALASRAPVLASLFIDSSCEAIDLARAAESAGASALLISQPHYLFQPTQAGLMRQFSEVRDACSIPVLLSNVVPSALVPASAMKALAERGLIDGVYQGVNPHLLADILGSEPRVPVFAGMEDLLYVGLVLGAQGIISVLAALFPEDCLALAAAVADADHAKARDIHERLLKVWRCLDRGSERFARCKHAFGMRGRMVGPARNPYHKLVSESAGEVESTIAWAANMGIV